MDNERKRKERFKKAVIASVAAAALLLVGLLIQGCKSERSASITPLQTASIPANTSDQKPSSILPVSQSSPSVAPQPAPTVSKASTMTTISHSATVYVVKSGDTLTRIAKTHGITVKSLKSVNDLASDRITVGAKLKIPTA